MRRACPGPRFREYLRRAWGSGPATDAKRFGMRGKSMYGSVSSHQPSSRAIQCTQASRYMVRIHSGEGDRVSYVSRWITADDPVLDLLSPSPSPWHGPQFEVLRVEVFRFSSSKISIFELSFLPEPTTRAVCREEGPETEFATAGT
jgi:hypothetical protein